MKPLIMVHAGGKGGAHGRENSRTAVLNSLRFKPDLIELDIRRSADDVLYCYHGFPAVPMFFLAHFLKYLPFATIRRWLRVNTLEEILSAVKKPSSFYLDIKDDHLAWHLDRVCRKFPRHQFWLASYEPDRLARWKKNLGSRYHYVYNFSFWNFKKGFRRAKLIGLYAFKLLPWQCTAKNIQRMRQAGIRHIIHPLLITRANYQMLIRRFGSLWVCVDDMRKPDRWFMGI